MEIKGKYFKKSSYSGQSTCVGVSIENQKIYVVNTNEKETIVEFTKEEWISFIKGVKEGEFDI